MKESRFSVMAMYCVDGSWVAIRCAKNADLIICRTDRPAATAAADVAEPRPCHARAVPPARSRASGRAHVRAALRTRALACSRGAAAGWHPQLLRPTIARGLRVVLPRISALSAPFRESVQPTALEFRRLQVAGRAPAVVEEELLPSPPSLLLLSLHLSPLGVE
ncbi:hypothetical protein KFK09_002884 [Dendrobium nobile]|uniref:Uncharacterized protein n=1 Tax=Dendrobium nobile TaxID=94219 RepID=A0A8T3C653_DENNO|nr:hypothetical protein KFK09_002884 [Dendrobium nobile]